VTAPAEPFVHRRRVEFAETDMAGQVHFTQFFRYMEEAEHAMWRAAGMSITGTGYGFPRVAAVTRSTIRYSCAIRRGETKVATGSMTTACVERRPGEPAKAVAIPADVLARLRPEHPSTG
jgi:acyl-CoA thioesterase FadM